MTENRDLTSFDLFLNEYGAAKKDNSKGNGQDSRKRIEEMLRKRVSNSVANMAFFPGDHYPIGSLEGLMDFVERAPFLTALKLTQCGAVLPSGFNYAINHSNVRPGEVVGAVDFHGFNFGFGINASPRGIVTKIAYPPVDLEAKNDIERNLKHYLDQISPADKLSLKFENAAVIFGSSSANLVNALTDQNDKVKGGIREYWDSYWNLALKPLITSIYRPIVAGSF